MPEATEFSDLFKYATLEELPPIMWGHRRNVKFGRICEVNIAGCARSMYVSPNDALLETLKRNVFAIYDETYFRIVNENKISIVNPSQVFVKPFSLKDSQRALALSLI